jgi:enoyl-CoA hydratase
MTTEQRAWAKGRYPFRYLKYDVNRKEKIATVTMHDESGRSTAPNWAALELDELMEEWERDDDVKVVILKSDTKDFCRGHDLGNDLTDIAHARDVPKDAAEGRRYRRTNRESIMGRSQTGGERSVIYSLKPTIAQVHGQCIEYGMGYLSGCDMAIASDDAHFGHLGQVIGMSGLSPTIRSIAGMGYKRFREMMTTGRTYDARQAVEMGLINRVVKRDDLEQEVWDEARRIAVIPLDGLVTGKYHAGLVLKAMEAGLNLTNIFWSGFMPNLKHEPDEFHFFEVVREKGVTEAIKQRRAIYDPLGGFGIAGEKPFIALDADV